MGARHPSVVIEKSFSLETGTPDTRLRIRDVDACAAYAASAASAQSFRKIRAETS
jgi:hypothetical protein